MPEQRRGDAEGGIESGLVVGQEAAGSFQWRLGRVGMAGGVKTPTAAVKDVDALGDLQLRWRLDAIRCDRAEHHGWVTTSDLGLREAEVVGPRRCVIVDDRVGGGNDRVQQLDLIGRGEVEPDRTLIGVQIREHRTAFWPTTIADERCHRPGRATTRAFDLDHLGAEIGKQPRAIAGRSCAPDLDNPQMRQRAHHASSCQNDRRKTTAGSVSC